MSNSAQISIKIAGVEYVPPLDWMDIGVLATFDTGETQGNISTQDFIFVLDAYERLKVHIAGGLASGPGIFEPLPITFETYSNLGTYLAFEGGVNLAEATRNDTLGQIQAPLTKDMGLNTLGERLSGLTYGLLVENGTITHSDYIDIEYVIVKPDTSLEAMITAITLYMMAKQLLDTVKEIGEQVATISGIIASGITGGIGGAILAAALVLINVAYAAALLILIIDLGKDLLAAFLQPTRTHKGIMLKTLLEKACQYLGYSFNTTIDDLDHIAYLPSNRALDTSDDIRGFLQSPGTITEGIPGAGDYGYIAEEIFRLCKDAFYAKYQLIGGTVEFHAENSPFWKRLSPWNFPSTLEGPYRYNTDELNSSVVISFATDISDQWTLGNFKGTNYQVITEPNVLGPSGRSHITGLDETALPVALGNRKEKLTGFEKFLKFVGGVIDDVTGTFGSGTNFAGQIAGKVGVLKVSENNHSIPKLLWMEGSPLRIPSNHRDLFSAKTLWNKYHNYKSFLYNNYEKQRKVYEGVEIRFGFADFLQLIDNSYFITDQGLEGKVIKLEWNMAKDTAIIDYWITHTYTKNLKETFVEPE